MKTLLPLLGAFFLSACGSLLPPLSGPQAWGVPYTAILAPPGSLAPFQARTVGYRVEVEQASTFLVAHELTHVWQWHHRTLAREFAGHPCPMQPDWNCTPLEAQADTVALAVIAAGCLPGDLGWPGEPESGCLLPDPAGVRP